MFRRQLEGAVNKSLSKLKEIDTVEQVHWPAKFRTDLTVTMKSEFSYCE